MVFTVQSKGGVLMLKFHPQDVVEEDQRS